MNEKIKLLAEQAKITFTNYGTGDFLDEGDIDLPRLKKLAELIVRECAQLARDTDLEDVEGGDSAVLRAAKRQILEHFGVEE